MRVAASQHAHVRIFDERLALEIGLRERRNVHCQVDAPRGEFARHRRAVDLVKEEAHAWRLGCEFASERRRKRRGGHVAGCHVERALGQMRFETLAAVQARSQSHHRVAHRADQLLGFGRGRHAAARSDEKRIAECAAQAHQRVAERRLRGVQHLARACQIAFDIDGFEDRQQIEIDASEVHPDITTSDVSDQQSEFG